MENDYQIKLYSIKGLAYCTNAQEYNADELFKGIQASNIISILNLKYEVSYYYTCHFIGNIIERSETIGKILLLNHKLFMEVLETSVDISINALSASLFLLKIIVRKYRFGFFTPIPDGYFYKIFIRINSNEDKIYFASFLYRYLIQLPLDLISNIFYDSTYQIIYEMLDSEILQVRRKMVIIISYLITLNYETSIPKKAFMIFKQKLEKIVFSDETKESILLTKLLNHELLHFPDLN